MATVMTLIAYLVIVAILGVPVAVIVKDVPRLGIVALVTYLVAAPIGAGLIGYTIA